MPKQPKTGEIIVNGKTYKLQHPGIRWYLENTDRCRNQAGVLQIAQYAQSLLDFVVTDPQGLKVDDFDSVNELEEFVRKAEEFLKS